MGHVYHFGKLRKIPMKPKLKDLFLFLLLEIASVVWASAVFALIPSKIIAGALGASFFLVISLLMLIKILKWPKCWSSWSLYPLLFFLFACVIPMILMRFAHPTKNFSELRILGMSAREFHSMSSATLGLLFIVTLAETLATLLSRKAR
jgi:hypothetical protein